MHPSKTILLALGLSVSLPALVATAQTTTEPTPSTPDASTPTLHVTSREIIVDVLVTDGKGQSVHGLKQSDFSMEENGKPQSIRSFREFSSEIPVVEHTQRRLLPSVYSNSQSTPATGPVNVILLDALHSKQIDVVRSMESITEYFKTMPQGTKVALFWLSESGLHMLQGFSSDPTILSRALHSNQIEVGARMERYVTEWITIDALNQIAAYVSAIKGRKNLLWFTPSMPVNLMRDGGIGWGATDMSKAHRLMDVYERFTAEQVAVSPIDPRGVTSSDGTADSFHELSKGQLKAVATAEDTGGEAFFNNNDLKSTVAKAIHNGSQFYTLSYVPPTQKDDGHYHHIKVDIAGHTDLHLIYRKGYNAERVPTLDAPAPGPALMKASMAGNAPAATQILFDVGVWPSSLSNAEPTTQPVAKSKSGKTVLYDVHYGFPPSEIAFLEDPDGMLHGSLEFNIAAYNDSHKLVAHLTQTVKINLSPDQYDDFIVKPYRLIQQLDLPLGQLSFHVGILDNVTSKVGTLEIPILIRPDNLTKQPPQASKQR